MPRLYVWLDFTRYWYLFFPKHSGKYFISKKWQSTFSFPNKQMSFQPEGSRQSQLIMPLATAVPLAPAPGLRLPWAKLTASAYQTSNKPSTVFNYVIFARLDFSELSILEQPNTGPSRVGRAAGRSGCCHRRAPSQPSCPQTPLPRSTATLEERATCTGSAIQEVKGKRKTYVPSSAHLRKHRLQDLFHSLQPTIHIMVLL